MPAKVAIVEDNPITVRSLVETIDWEHLGCVVVGTAQDGISGMDMVLEKKPDILLTDIRMPRKNGLEMAEELSLSMPDLKVIIISGYERFQYASQAIKLGVCDYILKPIRNEEVEQAVTKALERMRSEKEQRAQITQSDVFRKKALLLSLLTNDAHAGQDVSLMMEEVHLHAPAYYLMIIQPDGACTPELTFMNQVDQALNTCDIECVSVVLYDSMVVYVMCGDHTEGWKSQAAQVSERIAEKLHGMTRIGVSALAKSRHQIRQTYQQARQALWENTMSDHKVSATFFDSAFVYQDSPMLEMRSKIDELTDETDLSDESALKTARELVSLSGRQYSYLRALVSLYVLLLIKKCSCPVTGEIDRAMSSVWYVSNESNVAECLKRLYASIREASGPSDRCSLLTKSVLDYIRLHGAETIRLSDMALKFHVSSNYLSALIRRETGTTFHEHVLRAKMDIAHTMLADPRILVEEVASAVGYSNYVSFYNTFKRIEHMTPTEYRNSLSSGNEII